MNLTYLSTLPADWQQQVEECWRRGDYCQAANLYEQAIEAEPDTKSYYWHLGLLLLLQGQEAEAQTTWLLGMADGDPEQFELWTAELIQVLQTEAEQQQNLGNHLVTWAIRQHLREINPVDINNLLHLIGLSILVENYTGEELTSLGVIDLLNLQPPIDLDSELLMQVLHSVLECDPLHPSSLELASASLAHVRHPQVFIEIVLRASVEIAYSARVPTIAVSFVELALSLAPENLGLLLHLAGFYQNARQYEEGIKMAKLCYSLANELPDQVFANHKLLRGLMSAGGYWEEVGSVMQRHHLLLKSLIAEQPISLHPVTVQNLFLSPFFLPYFEDNPKNNRDLQNQISKLCQTNVQIYAKEQSERYRHRPPLRKNNINASEKHLKVGYLSHCLKRHSVGWLARWLFHHHNRDRIKIYGYYINAKNHSDNLQDWYISQCETSYKLGIDGLEIADKIYQDEIDILVDLDSITLDVTCEVMALKPAPIQVTWLGWDASGVPAIDYYMADPYVLPESAQKYYTEKIWRLPQTYIAVDGFEVDVPTLRRDRLDIPDDAVIYLSCQTGYKRNKDTARLQMKILKEVPNSYFLIKGTASEESIKCFFTELAEEQGVECDRLRFLPEVALEGVHRANLGIADVVLDTYPYNGATTTLETLWMGIPLVTRVGEQFAARNSYTMMMNVGITDGIAWTDEEYVEWGIRLGKDSDMRQRIAWKLRQSRQTSPLWNAKQFTEEMEKAYEQMWQIYVKNRPS